MAPLPLDLEQYPSRGLSHPLPCPISHYHLTHFWLTTVDVQLQSS